MRIKNWEKFQHYKHRRPPWIKLYREILDDIEWHKLSGDASKMLAMCWLIASDYNGELPDVKQLSFRLRMDEVTVNGLLSTLSHWIENIDSKVLAECNQDATPETEKSRVDIYIKPSFDFEMIWESYPNHDGKKAAQRYFNNSVKTEQDWLDINRALDNYLNSKRVKDGFIKNGSTWFNNWKDWVEFEETNKGGDKLWIERDVENLQRKLKEKETLNNLNGLSDTMVQTK